MAIRVYNVWKYFNGTPVLKGVSLDIEPGRVHVLLGPNGSGKTTLLRIIMGVYSPDRGFVEVFGKNPSISSIIVRKLIGYVPEEDIIYHSLRVREYLSFIASIYGVPKKLIRQRVESVEKAFKIDSVADEFIGDLSHGLKRRVLLAAAFVHNPQILLLDEPFMGLDPVIVKALKIIIRDEARNGKLVLVTTHILEIAEAIADNIILIYRGEIVAEGGLGSVLEKARAKGLEDAFLELTKSTSEVYRLVKVLKEGV